MISRPTGSEVQGQAPLARTGIQLGRKPRRSGNATSRQSGRLPTFQIDVRLTENTAQGTHSYFCLFRHYGGVDQ